MNNRIIDATTRWARAWIAEYDANKDGSHGMRDPLPCECQGCGGVFTRDTLVENNGRGYLCVECADREIRRYRSMLMKAGLLTAKDIRGIEGYPYMVEEDR